MAFTPGKIQFIANYDAWKCVKKFTTTELTDPKTVCEFFVSYSISLDNRMEKYLAQLMDVGKMKELIVSAPNGKTAQEVPALLQYVASPALVQKCNAIASTSKTEKSSHALLGKIVHAHVVRVILKQNGIPGDYSEVAIPGLKRLMKKKKGL
jgi:hypothetical protein